MAKSDVEGVDDLMRKLTRLAEKAGPAQLRVALLAGAKPIENTAVQKAPIDTGALRSSIHTETAEDGDGALARIGTNLEYAIYQEMGTSRMRAQPYLRPAFDENRTAALGEIERALKVMVKPE